MNKEQLQEIINWVQSQIDNANKVIREAHLTNNFGREAQYEGIRDAFLRCLKKLTAKYDFID